VSARDPEDRSGRPPPPPDEGAGEGREAPEGVGDDEDQGSKPLPGTQWARGTDQAYAVLSTLLSGLVVFGGLGFFVDWLVGFHYLFLPIGILVGLALGTYAVIVRYGSLPPPNDGGGKKPG
jgi:ATP synthase protein I